MKERPILYSAPMVIAKLAGRKTQTRRVVQPRLLGVAGQRPFGWGTLDKEHGITQRVACPYGKPGDRLWGRETFGATQLTLDDRHLPGIHYRATDDWPQRGPWPWRPSIFMPRWASRLLHEVVSVRVERLQDISNEDSIAEGIEEMRSFDGAFKGWCWPGGPGFTWPRDAYLAGWDTINGKGAAAKNPWVWRVETRPVT